MMTKNMTMKMKMILITSRNNFNLLEKFNLHSLIMMQS
jgi:hypothetical protein